jgi:hypothetical protein
MSSVLTQSLSGGQPGRKGVQQQEAGQRHHQGHQHANHIQLEYVLHRGENTAVLRVRDSLGASWLSWLGCSVAQFRVQRGSVSSALACCKAGPSSSSAPHGGSAH